MSANSFKLQTLPNGLQVMLVPREATEAVTVEYFFRAGSRYETPDINGLAHFTEHMVFKGSEHFPTFSDVNHAINSVGGNFNAYTGGEVMGFYVKLGAEKVEIALDVLSSILTTPKLDKDELDRERGVILEEINMYEDTPGDQIHMLLDKIAYPDHPIGWPTLGSKENIRSFKRGQFGEYMAKYLTPDRAVLAISGNVSRVTEKLLQKYNGRFSGSSDVAPVPAPDSFAPRKVAVRKRETEQTHIGMAMYAPTYADDIGSAQLSVLTMLLGGNSSSRLFTEVREKQGLAYYVYSIPEQLVDTGTLSIYAGVTNEKAGQALSSILRELKRVRDGDFTGKELDVAKESYKGTRALRWEDSTALGGLYADQQLLLGRVMTPKQIFEMIDAVTREDVGKLAADIVQDAKLSVAMIGPQDEDKIRKLATVDG